MTVAAPSGEVRAAAVEVDGGNVALNLAALDQRRHH